VVVPVDVAVLVLLRRDRSKAAYWALATGGAALLNVCAKHGFQRVRPDLWQPLSPEQSFSFPSGHAMQTMAMFAALMVLRRATPGAWALALAGGAYVAAVGLSRAYLGVHFPSDVLAGWCASITWCVGLAAMMRSNLIHGGHLTVA
jgi:undecaprenyl-diphosphatase